MEGKQWAFWAIAVSLAGTHIMWFVADAAIGNRWVAGNIMLSAIALTGVVLAGYGLKPLFPQSMTPTLWTRILVG